MVPLPSELGTLWVEGQNLASVSGDLKTKRRVAPPPLGSGRVRFTWRRGLPLAVRSPPGSRDLRRSLLPRSPRCWRGEVQHFHPGPSFIQKMDYQTGYWPKLNLVRALQQPSSNTYEQIGVYFLLNKTCSRMIFNDRSEGCREHS